MSEDGGLVMIDVEHRYSCGRHVLDILRGASLSVAPGEMVAIVAPSGAGKSTLLQLGGLLERLQGGRIAVAGVDTGDLDDRRRTGLRRNRIGYVYQFHNLLPDLTALENVALPQWLAGARDTVAAARASDLLGRLGIGDRADHRPSEMSGGEQQRVALARAFANSPKVLIADEPTGNLDPATGNLVFDAMLDMVRSDGVAALIATHDHSLARRADRVVMLKVGKIEPIDLGQPLTR